MSVKLFGHVKLQEVFTPGGQPSITYVDRAHLGVERSLDKAVRLPTTIVSLTGPTKSGKTVLCTSVLKKYQYVWIDGGQIKAENEVWQKVCAELQLANEIMERTVHGGTDGGGASVEGSVGTPGVAGLKIGFTASGSRLQSTEEGRRYVADTMQQAIEAMVSNGICFVIDDFHYIDADARIGLIRSLKGAVFRGLKVILLSTPHRAFDAIKAEVEVTGRFKHVTVPPWSKEDLKLIAETGFKALNVGIPEKVIERFAVESEGSPLLMQRFCWNACYDAEVEQTEILEKTIDVEHPELIFNEVAEDAGLPIYAKLSKGPQSRTDRIPRPLNGGGTADIYEAILLAIANTGPREQLSYDQIRTSLNAVLADKIPQKIEVSNALNHLTKIDADENRGQRAIDWDSENLNLFITDPFFRFYLRWRVATQHDDGRSM